MKKFVTGLAVAGMLAVTVSTANAIPALQLGEGAAGDWSYDTVTQTWVTNSSTFTVNATANSDGAGANGAYAWDPAGAATQYAYFVLAGVPGTNVTDGFDVSVWNDHDRVCAGGFHRGIVQRRCRRLRFAGFFQWNHSLTLFLYSRRQALVAG